MENTLLDDVLSYLRNFKSGDFIDPLQIAAQIASRHGIAEDQVRELIKREAAAHGIGTSF